MGRLAYVSVAVLCVVLLGFWVVGLYDLVSSEGFDLPWRGLSLRRLGLFTTIFVAVSAGVEYLGGRYGTYWYLGLGCLFTVAAVGFGPPMAAACYLASSLLLGDMVLRKCVQQPLDGHTEPLLALFLGLAVSVTLLGFVISIEVHHPLTYLVVLSVPLWLHPAPRQPITSLFGSFVTQSGASAASLGRMGIAYFAALYLATTLLPEVGLDALAAHLTVPAEVHAHHAWHFDVGRHVWSVSPMSGDWLYTWVYMLGGEYAARLTNFAVLLLLVCTIHRICVRHTSASIARLASVLFLSTPLAFLETGSLFIENFQAGLLLAGTISLYFVHRDSSPAYLLPAGAFFGTALAVKLGTLAFLPIPIAIAVYKAVRLRHTQPWRTPSLAAAAFVSCAAFPYVNAFLRTGNPVFPYANALFQSPLYATDHSFDNKLFHAGLAFDTLYKATFASGGYLEATPGALGFSLFGLLPLACLVVAIRRSYLAVLVASVSVSFFGAVFMAMAYLRYIYPAIPLFVILIALCLQALREDFRLLYRGTVVFACISIALNLLFLPAAGWHRRSFRLDLVLDDAGRRAFILQRLPIRRLVEYLNATYGDWPRVAFFSRPLIAELEGVPLTVSWHNYQFSQALQTARTDDEYIDLFRRMRITHFITEEDRVDSIGPLIASLSEKELSLPGVALRKATGELVFRSEALANREFREGLDSWSGRASVAAGAAIPGVRISRGDSISQSVDITGGRWYLLEVQARCEQPGGAVRMQVNWHDERGGLQPSLVVRRCSREFRVESQQFRAPRRAVSGTVFVVAQAGATVEVRSVSLRQ